MALPGTLGDDACSPHERVRSVRAVGGLDCRVGVETVLDTRTEASGVDVAGVTEPRIARRNDGVRRLDVCRHREVVHVVRIDALGRDLSESDPDAVVRTKPVREFLPAGRREALGIVDTTG